MISVDVGRGGGGVDGGVWGESAREGRRKKSTCGQGGRPYVLERAFWSFLAFYRLWINSFYYF